jgi:hypothetical protein
MDPKRTMGGALCLAVVLGASVASAASLGLEAPTLGAGTAEVHTCDPDGVALDYTVAFDDARGWYVIEAVVIRDIAAACAAGRLSLVLARDGESVAAGGPVSVPDGGDHLDVLLDQRPAVGSIDHVHVVIVGP